MKTFKHKTIVIGDFNINTVEKDNQTNYCNILKAHEFDIRNSLPTRENSTSTSCTDHFITQKPVEIETIKATISDHYSVPAQFCSETTQ